MSLCANCLITSDWYLLSDYITPAGEHITLCSPCAEAEEAVEAEASRLARLDGCRERDHILGRDLTARALVNALRAHDFACSCVEDVRKARENEWALAKLRGEDC
jgi:hypothetical protein